MNQVPVSLDGIRKAYGARVVLGNVSMTFVAGSVTAMLGPNGAGKTTLLRIAAGLQKPDAGTVVADRVGYFGGFDTMPLKGSVGGFRRALGLPLEARDRRTLSSLSRGELQWLGLEAIFAFDCRAVLLDEPWTGLEPDRKDDLSHRILEYAAAGNAVVCASHDLDEVVRIAHRLYVIGNGKVEFREHIGDLHRDALLQMYREAKTQ